MLKALIFDLGNVLAFHDNELLFAQMAKAYRTSREAMREKLSGDLWERVNKGKLPGDALRLELNARLNGALGEDEFFALWNCHFTLNPPMIERVEQLEGRFQRVLLSNTHDQHIAFLRPKLPLLERFDGLVFSCEVGEMKPSPVVYQRALSLAGCAANEACFFDDAVAYVEGARRLGLHAHVFTTVEQFDADLEALTRRR